MPRPMEKGMMMGDDIVLVEIDTNSPEWQYICDNNMQNVIMRAAEVLRGDTPEFRAWYKENVTDKMKGK